MIIKKLLIITMATLFTASVGAEEIGSVDTVFKMFGPDHKIVVEAFDDPDVQNVTCYIRLKAGWGWRKILPTRRSPVSRWDRLRLATASRREKRRAKRCSASEPRCCLRSCRWCVFMTRNAMR